LIPPEALTLFFLASLLLALAPGPDNLFVLTLSMVEGSRAGLLVTLGLCTGLLGHTALAAFGIAAMLKALPVAFDLLRWLGAAYLGYLAWGALRAALHPGDPDQPVQVSASALYRRGVIMNLTNPKVSIFFLAFLPQFTDPTRGPMVAQMLLLGALFIIAALLVFSLISLASGLLARRLFNSPRSRCLLDGMAGCVLLALALRLALFDGS
jgi:threonine/homoserine/homoserine lactone efflux protein